MPQSNEFLNDILQGRFQKNKFRHDEGLLPSHHAECVNDLRHEN